MKTYKKGDIIHVSFPDRLDVVLRVLDVQEDGDKVHLEVEPVDEEE